MHTQSLSVSNNLRTQFCQQNQPMQATLKAAVHTSPVKTACPQLPVRNPAPVVALPTEAARNYGLRLPLAAPPAGPPLLAPLHGLGPTLLPLALFVLALLLRYFAASRLSNILASRQPAPPSQWRVLRPLGLLAEVASFLPQCLQAGPSGCSRLQKPQTMRVAQAASWPSAEASSWQRSQGKRAPGGVRVCCACAGQATGGGGRREGG